MSIEGIKYAKQTNVPLCPMNNEVLRWVWNSDNKGTFVNFFYSKAFCISVVFDNLLRF